MATPNTSTTANSQWSQAQQDYFDRIKNDKGQAANEYEAYNYVNGLNDAQAQASLQSYNAIQNHTANLGFQVTNPTEDFQKSEGADFNYWADKAGMDPYRGQRLDMQTYNQFKNSQVGSATYVAPGTMVTGAGLLNSDGTFTQVADGYKPYTPSAMVNAPTVVKPYEPKNTDQLSTIGYSPSTGSVEGKAVDYGTETIEGRVQSLLDANNPVIRQAGDRAMAQFAGRGLLNSSMAIEAANEAMISKAIEIAGPDAQRYFQNRRENVDWTNKFAQNQQMQNFTQDNMKLQNGYTQDNLRLQSDLSQKANDSAYAKSLQTNYLTSIQNAESQMQRFIQQVQASDIPTDAKTEQIKQMQYSFNNTISMMKAAYQNMPQWVDEWSMLPATIGG